MKNISVKNIGTYIFFGLILILTIYSNLLSKEIKIIAKVKNQIITNFDIDKQSKYLQIINNELENLKENEIKKLSKNSIINEKIKEIELKKYYNLNENEDIQIQLLEEFYKKLNFSNFKDFQNYLNKYGLNTNEVRYKVTLEALWNELIYQKYQDKIIIDIDKIESNLRSKISKAEKYTEYNLSEIFINIKNSNNRKKQIEFINENINKNGFKSTAIQFSESDSAKSNGNIGWVNETQLSDDIYSVIKNLKKNQISVPINVPSGILYLKINDIKQKKIKINFEKELEKIKTFETNRQLGQFSNLYFNKIKKNLGIND